MSDPIRDIIQQIIGEVQSTEKVNKGSRLKSGEISTKDFDLIREWGISIGFACGGAFVLAGELMLNLLYGGDSYALAIGVVMLIAGGVMVLVNYIKLLKADLGN